MRRITRKQILARLFIGFFTAATMLCTVNSAVAGGPQYSYGNYYIIKEDKRDKFPFDSANGIKRTNPASNNIVEVTITGSDSPTSDIYSGYTDSDGDTSNNRLKITTNEGAATKLGTVYGGYTEDGNANSNTVEITNSKTGTVWGGHIASESSTVNTTNSNTLRLTNCEINNAGNIVAAKNYGAGNAVENTVEVRGGIVKSDLISGAQLLSGDAISNKVTISDLDSPATYTLIIGGTVTNGNAYSNAVTLDNLKELNGTNSPLVAGGYVATGEAASNTVTIKNNSSVITSSVYGVYGGYVGSGSATLNEVHITDSTISGLVYGGYIGNDGNATGNTVEISDGSTTDSVYGGYVGSGSATLNEVHITDSTTGAVKGGLVAKSGSATQNTVDIVGSEVNAVYGGHVMSSVSDATQNIVNISSSTVKGLVAGGVAVGTGSAELNEVHITSDSNIEGTLLTGGQVQNGDAKNNTVEISDSKIKKAIVYGGSVSNTGSATQNIVKISSSTIEEKDVYGGFVNNNGNATGNTVEISGGSSVESDVYGGYVKNNGNATGNTVEISGGSTVNGMVFGGYVGGEGDAKTGNKLIISGAGNTIGGQIVNFETMTFDASDVKKDETMLSLTTEEYFTIDVKSIETNNANLAIGEKITLISSAADNPYDGNITYKIDGKKAIKDSNKFIANIAKEDSDKVVHVNEYAYEYNRNDYKLNLCNNSGFITGLYSFDADDAKQTLGQAEMTVSSVPENVTEIYGAYSEDADVTAGGATINLETTELSDVDLIGSYNLKDETKVDTSNNTLNVNVSGVKVKSVEGFGNLNFKLALDEKAMLDISDSYDMNGVTFNSILPEDGFVGTQTILKTGSLTNDSSAKFKINDEEVDSTKTLTITTRNTDSVVYGTYNYGISSEIITLTGKSIVSAVNINSGETKAADNNTLKVTAKMAEKYTELYGAFNADGGAATNATVELSEAVSNENLTIYGGYSTGSGVDVTTGNTLKVSKNGNKVKNILNFSTLDFSLDSDNSNNPTMLSLAADTVDLSNASINVNLTNALAEGQTVTLLGAAQQLNLSDDKLTIDGKALGVDLSLNIAKKVEEKYVNVGGYSLEKDTSKLSIKAKDAILTGRYRNGAEDLSVEKFELTNDLSKFKNIYGSYSADNSAAEGGKLFISEKADLSDTTLIGGKSAGNGEVKNNTLEIASAAAGSKVKGVEKFDNIKFVLASGASENAPVLSTTDKVVLEGTTIDTDMSGFKASDNTSLVLLDNTEGKAAKRLINGTEGEAFNAKDNGSFVAINSFGYSEDEGRVAIDVKNVGAAGAFIDKDGNLTGRMELTLGDSTASNVRANVRAGFLRASEGSDLSGYEDIYGIYSTGDAEPTGATVEIVSAIDYSNSVIHGGYSTKRKSYNANGNILNVNAIGAKVKGITDFENMNFNLPSETKNGDTMLKVTEAVDMAPTTVGVNALKAIGLKAGDSVNLIASDEGIQNFDSQKYTISGLTDKTGEVKVEDKALVLALDENGEKPNKNTKAPVEAVSATMALVNQASALASSKLNKSMITAVASANGGSATFASMNGGHSKYETGSYVEADSWNIGFGIAKKGMSSKNPDSTYGLFFQYGKSNFDTHNDGGFRGDGDSKMFGAGLTFHQEARSKFYYHGNIYAGKVDAKWNCSEGGYDDDAAYWGMTFGMGRKHNAGGNKTMDVYGRYSFNHVGSMDGKIGGNEYRFDSTTSHNLRLGLRMEYAQKNAATAYWGLAWEHEFAGDSKATVVKLGRTDSPTLNGNTGIAEVGYEWKRGNWEYNINAEGSFGKRKGVTGSFNINYSF